MFTEWMHPPPPGRGTCDKPKQYTSVQCSPQPNPCPRCTPAKAASGLPSYFFVHQLWYLKTVFLVATPVALQFLGPLAWNWLGEEQLPRERWGMQRDLWNRGKNVFVLALAMGCGTLLNVVVTLLNRTVAGALPEQLSYLPLVVWSVAVSVVLVCFVRGCWREAGRESCAISIALAEFVQGRAFVLFCFVVEV